MNLFETTAHAAEAAGAGPDAGLINLIMLGGFVIIFYFLLNLYYSIFKLRIIWIINYTKIGIL